MHAQRFVAFAGGTNVSQGPALQSQNLSAGVTGQVSMGYRVATRLRLRFDALVTHFTASAPQVAYPVLPCPSPGCGSGTAYAAPVGSVGVGALTVNEVIDVVSPARGPGLYLIAGGGGYYMFQNPTAPTLMRFGLSGGAGLEVPLGGSSALVFEARYHGLVNAPSDSRWFVPVTVGMRF